MPWSLQATHLPNYYTWIVWNPLHVENITILIPVTDGNKDYDELHIVVNKFPTCTLYSLRIYMDMASLRIY
jgi:cellulose biosynthesis protein BcsQ